MLSNLVKIIKKYPERDAFCIDGIYYTYSKFAEYISKIKYAISEENLPDNKRIGIIVGDDIETYASIFAVWFLGFTYIPISINNPVERNLKIIDESDIHFIISNRQEISCIKDNVSDLKTVCTHELPDVAIDLYVADFHDEDFMYILFTSGSTGVPKGVPISKKNLYSFIDSFFDLDIELNQNDKFLQMFELTFDVSVACTIIPLLRAACVYTVSSGIFKYISVAKLLSEKKITIATIVPSLISFLKPYFNELSFPDVKYCIVTAEASSEQDIKEWSKCIFNSDIYNLYGPTEATIWCLYYIWKKDNKNNNYNGLIPIGKPLKNVEAVILDANFEKVNFGEKGELCIKSDQLTKGYINDPERNEKGFINLKGDDKNIYYRTGDLCYTDVDDNIMYCGRMDNQVQIQGFRVELGEIEYHVKSNFNVKNAVAVISKNEGGHLEIHLFLENLLDEIDMVEKFLSSKLPNYMIPKTIRNIEQFPLNNSNKIDKNKLVSMI